MAAALQCPDCGHQEMLEHLGGVSTFRCGGCGRALKVPAQFRDDAPARAPRRPAPGPDATQALPRVGPSAAAAAAAAADPPVSPVPGGVANPGVPTARTPAADPGMGIDGVGAGAVPPGRGGPREPVGAPAPKGPPPEPISPETLKPPLILRLILWVIALPLGSLIVFALASAFGVLTKSQLEDTFLRADWGRFLPIARLLPFCALATALLVQLGVFLLEQLRARNLRNGPRRRGGSGGRGGRGGSSPGPTRPLSPRGPAQRATNGGGRTRDRVTS